MLGIVNGDIGGGSLALKELTYRGTFIAFSSLHLLCTCFWRDMLFASLSVIPATLISILVLKSPLVPPNNLADFSTKGYSFLILTMLSAYCFMLTDKTFGKWSKSRCEIPGVELCCVEQIHAKTVIVHISATI